MDDKQYSRQGKFLLYWMTTTSISTLTSFTATRSTANVKFSKNNIDSLLKFSASFMIILFTAPWVPWPAPQVGTLSANAGKGSDLPSPTLWLDSLAISIKDLSQLKISGLANRFYVWAHSIQKIQNLINETKFTHKVKGHSNICRYIGLSRRESHCSPKAGKTTGSSLNDILFLIIGNSSWSRLEHQSIVQFSRNQYIL